MILIPEIAINEVTHTNVFADLIDCRYNFKEREGVIELHIMESEQSTIKLSYSIRFAVPQGSVLSEEALLGIIKQYFEID